MGNGTAFCLCLKSGLLSKSLHSNRRDCIPHLWLHTNRSADAPGAYSAAKARSQGPQPLPLRLSRRLSQDLEDHESLRQQLLTPADTEHASRVASSSSTVLFVKVLDLSFQF